MSGQRIFGSKTSEISAKGREKRPAEAKGLLRYWAMRELRYRLTGLAKRPWMTQPGVGYALKRGERITLERSLTPEDQLVSH